MNHRGLTQRFLFATLVVGNLNCATIWSLSADRVEGDLCETRDSPAAIPRVYGGIVGEFFCISGTGSYAVFCIIDLPLTLAADTAVLPYTLYTQLRFGSYHPRFVAEVHKRLHPDDDSDGRCRSAIPPPVERVAPPQ